MTTVVSNSAAFNARLTVSEQQIRQAEQEIHQLATAVSATNHIPAAEDTSWLENTLPNKPGK